MKNAVPIAALQAVLICWIGVFAVARNSPSPSGVLLETPRTFAGFVCENDRGLIVRMAADGSTEINETTLDWNLLVARVNGIMATRFPQVVLLDIDPSLPVGTVLSRIADLHAAVPNMHMTPIVKNLDEASSAMFAGREVCVGQAPPLRIVSN
jgi:biopolymer transport protein ExbD